MKNKEPLPVEYIQGLKDAFENNPMSKSIINDFKYLGYMDSYGALTKFGLKQYKAFCVPPNLWQKILGYYCHYILRF